MKKNSLLACIILLFLSIFIINSFAQTLPFNPQIPIKTQTTCRRDWDCRSLNTIVKLDQNRCIGNIKYYRPDHPLFQPRGAPNLIPLLVGKQYTDFVQTGYKVEYSCGRDGFCEVSKTDAYGYGAYERCQWGCLVTPIEYKGKVYSNFCICMGGILPGKPFCDYSKGNDVYNRFQEWTCEVEIRVTMLCGVGSKCGTDPKEGIGCWPIEGASAYGYNSQETQYTLLIHSMNEPIYVAALQNGKVIAKRPISSMSALEYISKYGPVNASNAYAFAQKAGLTTLASGNGANRTPSRIFSSTRTTFGSIGTLGSAVANIRNNTSARTLTGTLSIASAGINSYKTASSYINSYSNYYYKPTTTYRTSSSSSYSTTYYRPTTSYTTYYTSYTPSSTYSSYRSTYYRPTTYSNYSSSSSTASRYSYPTYSSYSYYRRYRYYTPTSTSRSTGNSAVSSTASTYSSSRYYYARRFS